MRTASRMAEAPRASVAATAGWSLSGVVGKIHGAAADVSHPAEDPDHCVHLAVVAFVDAVQRHQGIEQDHVDLPIEDSSRHLLNQARVNLEIAEPIGDLQRHIGTAGDCEPAVELLLGYLVVFADRADAPGQLLLPVLAVVQPYPATLLGLVAEKLRAVAIAMASTITRLVLPVPPGATVALTTPRW